MANSKTASLTFRIDPSLKEALRIAAHAEHRSIANMIEVLIRDYCEQRGIAIPDSETENKSGCSASLRRLGEIHTTRRDCWHPWMLLGWRRSCVISNTSDGHRYLCDVVGVMSDFDGIAVQPHQLHE